MSRAAGPGRTQKVKSQQKEEALAAAREQDRLAAQERISTNTQRVAASIGVRRCPKLLIDAGR